MCHWLRNGAYQQPAPFSSAYNESLQTVVLRAFIDENGKLDGVLTKLTKPHFSKIEISSPYSTETWPAVLIKSANPYVEEERRGRSLKVSRVAFFAFCILSKAANPHSTTPSPTRAKKPARPAEGRHCFLY
jgi:hypothetical protein